MTDAREVAGKLTKAQREAVLDARDMMSGHGGYPFFTVSFTGDPWPQGFAEFISFRQDRLTPLGIAVRRILMEQDHDQG